MRLLILLVGLATACGAPLPPDAANCDVPTSKDALFSYLKAGTYRAFAHESAIHPSAGPHGAVLTYLAPTLHSSLAAGNSQHPKCAAAVKEVYTGTQLAGWTVSVKIADASKGGQGWYWYENFNTTNGDNPAASGVGISGCSGCHSAGKDYVRTTFPLQ